MNAPFERFSVIFLAGSVAVAMVIVLGMFASAPAPTSSADRPAGTAATDRGSESLASDGDGAVGRSRDYDLEAVASGELVPRQIGRGGAPSVGGRAVDRRNEFVRRALPVVLSINEEILADRGRLWTVRQKERIGEQPTAEERLWIEVTANRYGVSASGWGQLNRRIDVVPPSVALAIVVIEHRWQAERGGRGAAIAEAQGRGAPGSDRSEPDANDDGEEPLSVVVRRTVHALNTSPAHEPFRAERERRRLAGAPLVGSTLARLLPAAPSAGLPGGEAVRAAIAELRLDRFDAARLEPIGGPV